MTAAYRPSWPFNNGKANTILTTLWRGFYKSVGYRRLFIPTPDQDTLAVDKAGHGRPHALLMVHGLEGSSSSAYMQGLTRAALDGGMDVFCLNLRGCGGHQPARPATYHSGKTADLATVVHHLEKHYAYQGIGLVGFSLGGNLVLKYTGEQGVNLPPHIKAVSALGMPFDLASAARAIDRPGNWLFRYHFLSSLKRRARFLKQHWPELPYTLAAIRSVNTLWGFDEAFTAPMNGFRDATEYYQQCSAKGFLDPIAVPSQLIVARDDPFVPESSIPASAIRQHPHLSFLHPEFGGHLGFGDWNMPPLLWHEHQVMAFMRAHLN